MVTENDEIYARLIENKRRYLLYTIAGSNIIAGEYLLAILDDIDKLQEIEENLP